MCGIAGVIHYQDIDLSKLMHALKHRGPDDQTIYQEDHLALIHTRLAIQDIAHGNQPFHFENYSIVFNGEIYNHLALRKHLAEFQFQTLSDTETLLYLFIKYKYKMFDLLDGMFAFAIYDRGEKKLILARDRAGKKPLYYYHKNGCFIFASELNAIKSVIPLTINKAAIQCYLRAGYIWQPHTPYQEVVELEAASYLILDMATLNYKIDSYFDIGQYYQRVSSTPATFDDSLLELETRLKQSIADRLTASDVEVGVFLSGGIDSNLIAALATQIKPDVKTFTVKFSGSYDESALAKLTADKYQTTHTELTISTDFTQDIEKILRGYGEPFMDSSAIPSYYVSREARKHVKVVLGGDGADELFAGYRRYVPAANGLMRYAKWMAPFHQWLPKPKQKQSLYNYLHRLIAMSRKTGLDFYLSATSDIVEDNLFIPTTPITDHLNDFINRIFSNHHLSALNKMLYADFSILLFCDLLVKMDIASMANSLEVRSPFLSKHLLEFAPSLPDNYKINKLKTKYILRKLAEKHLPKELVNQPKRGFEVPLKKWVDHELRDSIFDRLQPGSYAEEFISPEFIQKLLAKEIHISPEKRAKILWSFYCLQVWYLNRDIA